MLKLKYAQNLPKLVGLNNLNKAVKLYDKYCIVFLNYLFYNCLSATFADKLCMQKLFIKHTCAFAYNCGLELSIALNDTFHMGSEV